MNSEPIPSDSNIEKPPIVLTSVWGYNRQQLHPFVSSWQRNVGEAELVMFVSELESDTIDWLLGVGIKLVPVSLANFPAPSGWRRAAQKYSLRIARRLFEGSIRISCKNADSRIESVRESLLDVSSSRFPAYLQYLKICGHRYSGVLLTDCRDVVFQSSPFPVNKLDVFCEDQTIGDSHFARRWMQLTYGGSMWKKLADKPVICSGTTLGPVSAIIDYLKSQVSNLNRVMALGGEDQAVHNVIIHCNRVPAKIHPFGEGSVITLNNVSTDNIRLREGTLENKSGEPYPIVHQYDRVKGLTAQLAAANLTDDQ